MADIPPGAHGSRTHGIKYVMVASQANLRYEWKDVLEHHKQSGSYVKTMKAFGIRSKSTMSNIVNRSKAGMIRSLTPGMAGSPAQ